MTPVINSNSAAAVGQSTSISSERRGIEHFAEIFVFGLLDQPRRSLEIEIECPAAAAAFEQVTGIAPIGPGVPWCVETQGA